MAFEIRDLGRVFKDNLLVAIRIDDDVVGAVARLDERFVVGLNASNKRGFNWRLRLFPIVCKV
jgi:hypothetical protein